MTFINRSAVQNKRHRSTNERVYSPSIGKSAVVRMRGCSCYFKASVRIGLLELGRCRWLTI